MPSSLLPVALRSGHDGRMDAKAVDIVDSGLVQGVFFRVRLRERAEQLGVHGWVRNDDDGSLVAHLEGPQDSVDALVAWCEEGPPVARVSRVTVTAAPEAGARTFEIRP